MNSTDLLAQRIVQKSSWQTYLTIKLLVDKGMVNDAYKAYAYFRWLDDEVDENLKTKKERKKLIKRQGKIITMIYAQKKLPRLTKEEQMIRDLIVHNPRKGNQLKSYIVKFLRIIEFDVNRRGKIPKLSELNWYSKMIGQAVTDCIQYFIGRDIDYPKSTAQYKAATAAHIVHSLRDLEQDTKNGYFNFPSQYKDKLPEWIDIRANLARRYFKEGKMYIKLISGLRCKLAAYLYCWRFEPWLWMRKKL